MFDTIRAMVDQKVNFSETASLLIEEASELPVSQLFFEAKDDLFNLDDGDNVTDDGEAAEEDEGDEVPDKVDDMMSVRLFSPAEKDDAPDQATDDADLMSVTIDLRSNTNTDVLPVPPFNAGDAVQDDMLSTRIDDGFAESGEPETAGDEEPEVDAMTEAIKIDGDEKAEKTEPKKAKADEPDEVPDDTEDTSSVTDAVMDKVADSEFGDTGGEPTSDVNLKLQEKLDKLQADIIRVKDLVRKNI